MAEGLSLGAAWRQHRVALPVVACLLTLAVALVYARTIHYPFINFDDGTYVYNNPNVFHGLTGQGIVWALTCAHSCNWHPITWISHQLDCQIYGNWPGGHHLTNVLLHATTAILLLFVLLRWTGHFWSSAMMAALFAVHPLRVESVAWIAERKDVLSGMFFMLTLGAYTAYAVRPFSWSRYLAVVLLFALGLLAKSMLVTLPCVLLLLDYWPLRRFLSLPTYRESRSPERVVAARLVLEKIPLVGLSAVSCVVTLLAQTDAMRSEVFSLPVRLGNALVAYLAYLGQFLWPARLAVLYPHPGNELSIAQVLASALVLAGLTAIAVVCRRKRPYLLVGWLWYLVMLLPVIGLVQVGAQGMADRYTYLPQIGIVIALVRGMVQVCSDRRLRQEISVLASAVWLLALVTVAWYQVDVWRDSESLWRHALACTSRNYVAHGNLAGALGRLGRMEEAIVECRESLRVKPAFVKTHQNLAALLQRAGRLPEAIVCYQETLELRPDDLVALNNLANDLRDVGRYQEAAIYYSKAMREGPEGAQACDNFGHMLVAQGKIDQAIRYFQQAIQHDPSYAQAYDSMGKVSMRVQRMADAISWYKKALALDPDSAEAHYDLGDALMRLGRSPEAIAHYEQAAQQKDFHACCRLAWMLATREPSEGGDPARALAWAEKARELSRGQSPAALDALAAAYAASNRFPEAVAAAQCALAMASRSGDASLGPQIQQHLQLYQQNHNCRSP